MFQLHSNIIANQHQLSNSLSALIRTYELRLANGRITHRNRKMIRKWHASNDSSPKNCIAEEKIPPDITNSPRRSERIRKKVHI